MHAGYLFFGSIVDFGRRARKAAATLIDDASDLPAVLHDAGLDGSDEPDLARRFDYAVARAYRFLVLDFGSVTGIDATTGHALKMLRRVLAQRRCTLVLAGVSATSDVARLLIANGIVARDGAWERGPGEACPTFSSLDAAMYWCATSFTCRRSSACY